MQTLVSLAVGDQPSDAVRHRVVHFNVTANPSAQWAARQITQAFPFDTAPRFLLHDRDGRYGDAFHRAVANLGIEGALTASHSPRQNPYVERLIGSIRRECLDHMVIINERHLMRILASYFSHYNLHRAHLSLDRNAPVPRAVQPSERGRVIAMARVGGLHYCYTRAA